MSQSSIEWLINHWKKLQSEGEKMSWNQIIEITELAKPMHKEEIRVAYMEGAFEKMRHLDGKEFMMPTDYYNETFGGNNGK